MTKTFLIVPKEEAKRLIEAQIGKGRLLMNSRVRNKAELRAIDEGQERWTDYNIQLCRELFSDGSLADEIKRYKTRLHQDWSFKQEVKYHRDMIREQMNNLISIGDRLEIMTVQEQIFAEAQPARPQSDDAGIKHLIKTNKHWVFEGIGTQTVQWIGSGLLIAALFVSGYFWSKPANTAQPIQSPSPQTVPTPVITPNSTPAPSSSTAAVSPALSSPNAAVSPYDSDQIVSSVDPSIWPLLIGIWSEKDRNKETVDLEPSYLRVEFYSESGVLKCRLIIPSARISSKTCTKLIVDGSRILFSFGGSDYTGRLDLKRQSMEGRIISYGDNEDRGAWSLTR